MPRNKAPANRRAKAPAPVPAPPENKRWFTITNLADKGVAEIKLYGDIGVPKESYDFWTDQLMPNEDAAGTLQEFESELTALGDVKELQLSIFSAGGDVFTGMAIHNLLVRHPANKICIIDGLCGSAATYPALACDEIQIPANAWMMIHGASGCVCGEADDIRQYAEMLDTINGTVASLYAARTGKTVAEMNALMDQGTWLNGQEAVDLGLADTVIEPLANLASRAGTVKPTNRAVLNHAPADVLALFDMTRVPNATRQAAPPPPATTAINMLRNKSPLMNAAEQGGSASTGNPAPAPAPTLAPAPAAAPAAAPAPATAPQNATAPDIAAIIKEAVNNAVAPLQAEVTRLTELNKAGITNLAGSPPAATGTPPAGGEAPVDFSKMSSLQLINFGRSQLTKNGAALPPPTI